MKRCWAGRIACELCPGERLAGYSVVLQKRRCSLQTAFFDCLTSGKSKIGRWERKLEVSS